MKFKKINQKKEKNAFFTFFFVNFVLFFFKDELEEEEPTEDEVSVGDDTKEEALVTMTSEDTSLVLPAIVYSWPDRDQQTRLSVKVCLLSGVQPDDLQATIESGGLEVRMSIKWPSVLTCSQILLSGYRSGGLSCYPPDHTKSIALGNAIKELRFGRTGEEVLSIFKLPLPFQVEECFCAQEGHEGLDLLEFSGRVYLLHLEMMKQRTSYSARKICPGKYRKVM